MRKHNPEWWIGEFWCKPVKGESAALCHIRYWLRAIWRLFRPALMSLFCWATWPNTEAFVCSGYGEDVEVEAWVL